MYRSARLLVCGLSATWRYHQIDRQRSISVVDGGLREKKGRRRKRGKEERIPRVILARAPSLPVDQLRATAALARDFSPMWGERSRR
ncbi:hypothetical protein B296_00048113, partial [Ensete ventricosum]